MAEWVERPSPVLGDRGIRNHWFEPWSSQIKNLKINTSHFLTRHSALFGWVKDWLAQCQDNVTRCDIRSCCWWPGFPVGLHYKVTMSVHCHKSVPILIWQWMLPGRKTPTTMVNEAIAQAFLCAHPYYCSLFHLQVYLKLIIWSESYSKRK